MAGDGENLLADPSQQKRHRSSSIDTMLSLRVETKMYDGSRLIQEWPSSTTTSATTITPPKSKDK